jgi:secretion/DNA translocation related CpaE-like protein
LQPPVPDPFPRTSEGPSRPLLATGRPELLDDLLRLAAAAGVEAEVATDPIAARASWARAPLVLVGDDVAALAGDALPRRSGGVVLVGVDLDDAGVWEHAVAVGAERVVFLPDAEDWLVARLADSVEGGATPAPLVAVVGGSGGAGASTLSAALAVTALRLGARPWLVDADPLGGGIDLAIGGEDTVGLRWPDLLASRGRVSAAALRSSLPAVEGDLVVLSWDRSDRLVVPPPAMRSVLAAARRGGDLVVVDLPRRVDEAAAHVLTQADVTLLVVRPAVRATAAAARVAASMAGLARDVRLVVIGTSSGLPPGAVADALGLPLLAAARTEPGLAAAADRGEPPARSGRGSLAELCGRILREVGVTRRDAA